MNLNISDSNIKLILEHYFKNKNSIQINELYEFYQPTEGFLYCLHNEIFNFYGNDLYKCGNSIDTDKRLCQYTTSYPLPSKILLISDSFFDKSFAETLLFFYLKDFKFKPNREFIKCDFNIIKDAFDKVKHFFSIFNTKQLLIDYLINDDNYKKYFIKSCYFLSDEDKFKKNIDVILNIINVLQINCDKIINNEEEFINFISKYLFELNYNEFIDIFNNHYISFGKYKYILDKINCLFVIEKNIDIQRLQINNIDTNIDIDHFLDDFINNIDKFYVIFKGKETKSKTIDTIKKKIYKIKKTKPTFKYSHFLKFIAECYNHISNDNIKIISKSKRVKNVLKLYYIFVN